MEGNENGAFHSVMQQCEKHDHPNHLEQRAIAVVQCFSCAAEMQYHNEHGNGPDNAQRHEDIEIAVVRLIEEANVIVKRHQVGRIVADTPEGSEAIAGQPFLADMLRDKRPDRRASGETHVGDHELKEGGGWAAARRAVTQSQTNQKKRQDREQCDADIEPHGTRRCFEREEGDLHQDASAMDVFETVKTSTNAQPIRYKNRKPCVTE